MNGLVYHVIAVVLAVLLLDAHRAGAQRPATPVRTLFLSQADGLSGPMPTLSVWSGQGTNLSFLNTGEVIKKVWLADPSRVTLDFDGSLCRAGSNGGGREDCQNSGASVIHLRRVVGVRFPNVTTAATTTLSVITEGTQGRKLYQFRVLFPSDRSLPQYTTLALYPDPPPLPSAQEQLREQLEAQRLNPENIQRGLNVARQQRLIDPSENLWNRVQMLLNFLRTGYPLNTAAQQAGVSRDLVERLAQLGQRPGSENGSQSSPPQSLPAENTPPREPAREPSGVSP